MTRSRYSCSSDGFSDRSLKISILQLAKECKENTQNEKIFLIEKGPKRHTHILLGKYWVRATVTYTALANIMNCSRKCRTTSRAQTINPNKVVSNYI
jgi:hypothetical protein